MSKEHRLASGVSPDFKQACERAEIPPTRRQWRKWLRGMGKAYAHR